MMLERQETVKKKLVSSYIMYDLAGVALTPVASIRLLISFDEET